TGYTREEAIGKRPSLLKSGRTPLVVYQELWKTITSGRIWKSEVLNRRKSGDLFWDAITIAPIKNSRGQITHFVGTQEDITERRHAQQTLKDQHQRFQQLTENIADVFFVNDAQFRETLYISPAFEKIWGRSCESVYENPSSFLEAIPPEDRDALVADILRTQKGEIAEAREFRVERPDGTVRWVLGQAVPIRNERGEVYRISGVARDVTERRHAQEALAASEARYRTLTEASFDGIAVSDHGIIREANRGFSEMFGYDLVEVIGRDVIDFVAEESVDDVVQRVHSQISGTYEFIGKRKDGREIIVEATAKALDVSGKLERITALRDITEKRQLETQFRQAQKMEAVGRLAGGVAHDFNNLLTVIISYAEMLLRENLPDESFRTDLEQIRKAADGAAVLTRQLLAFSRQQVVQPRPVRLEDVITAAESLIRRMIGEDVALSVQLNHSPAAVMVDPGQMEQVLLNLASNARDAMTDGGKLSIETDIVFLDEEYTRLHYPATPGKYAVVSMTDTGVGMDKETQARIFEPFFTTKETGHGTGLGLAMVYGIVKQSGGFIWVYSEPGKGTTFRLYFPVVDQPPMRVDKPAQSTEVVGGTETVLIVEDSAIVRSLAADILNRFGYRTFEAGGSREAVETAANLAGAIDLLLTDVVLPEESGRVVAARLVERWPRVRVLFMSGYAPDAVLQHGVLAAGTAYIQKPFTPSQLARKVREVLDAESTRENIETQPHT
ncbi:MAG: PAS domain S-box protein, partial [Gemmatimonadota bacterium]